MTDLEMDFDSCDSFSTSLHSYMLVTLETVMQCRCVNPVLGQIGKALWKAGVHRPSAAT
jgi:hypothetical protein